MHCCAPQNRPDEPEALRGEPVRQAPLEVLAMQSSLSLCAALVPASMSAVPMAAPSGTGEPEGCSSPAEAMAPGWANPGLAPPGRS